PPLPPLRVPPVGPGGRPSHHGCNRGSGCRSSAGTGNQTGPTRIGAGRGFGAPAARPWASTCGQWRRRGRRLRWPGGASGIFRGMGFLDSMRGWVEARREKARAFVRFLVHRFIEDRCLDSAATLAYATLFAAVPLAAVVFGIVSMFQVYEGWIEELTRFVFTNFVPGAAD